MFRISNKSVFEQPSGTDYVRKPRFDCNAEFNLSSSRELELRPRLQNVELNYTYSFKPTRFVLLSLATGSNFQVKQSLIFAFTALYQFVFAEMQLPNHAVWQETRRSCLRHFFLSKEKWKLCIKPFMSQHVLFVFLLFTTSAMFLHLRYLSFFSTCFFLMRKIIFLFYLKAAKGCVSTWPLINLIMRWLHGLLVYC